MSLIVDTSGVIASMNRNDAAHRSVSAALQAEAGPLILPVLVIAEVDYLALRYLGQRAEETFLEDVSQGAFAREELRDEDLDRGLEIIRRYSSHKIGIVDATLVALAERLNIDRVLTLDFRHFRTLKIRDRRPFTIVPADT